jgi:hypothetical protein
MILFPGKEGFLYENPMIKLQITEIQDPKTQKSGYPASPEAGYFKRTPPYPLWKIHK